MSRPLSVGQAALIGERWPVGSLLELQYFLIS